MGTEQMYGATRVPKDRLEEQPRCRECGRTLGAGYLCDSCDTLVIHDE